MPPASTQLKSWQAAALLARYSGPPVLVENWPVVLSFPTLEAGKVEKWGSYNTTAAGEHFSSQMEAASNSPLAQALRWLQVLGFSSHNTAEYGGRGVQASSAISLHCYCHLRGFV